MATGLTRVVLAGCCLVFVLSAQGGAQGKGILKKVTNKAKSTAVGKVVSGLSAKAGLLDATTVDLDPFGLPTIPVGPVTFGIAAVEIRNGEAIRVQAYLHNAGSDAASVPVPSPGLFVLVDEKGRRLERLGEVDVENLEEGATQVSVPPLERVTLHLLFGELKPDARSGTLKVGNIGVIGGIPLHTEAAAELVPQAEASDDSAGSNPWKQPPQGEPPQLR